MKKHVLEFLRRGIVACGLGPLVLAVFYLILQHRADVNMLTVDQVCLGIFSLSALAFVAGGMNFIYQIECVPLMVAILIHGGVLFISYLATYLVNGWLQWGVTPILVFSGIFVLGYLVIWGIIYSIIKRRTDSINEKLKQGRRNQEKNS